MEAKQAVEELRELEIKESRWRRLRRNWITFILGLALIVYMGLDYRSDQKIEDRASITAQTALCTTVYNQISIMNQDRIIPALEDFRTIIINAFLEGDDIPAETLLALARLKATPPFEAFKADRDVLLKIIADRCPTIQDLVENRHFLASAIARKLLPAEGG